MRFVFSVLPVLCLFAFSCSTVPAKSAPLPAPSPKATPTPLPVPTPPAAPVPSPIPSPVFQVSPEKKQASFEEIKVLVDKLNALIETKNFGDWKLHLDGNYIRTYGDPVKLKEYSEGSPFLKQYNVKLKTLEDFFKFVVVPSRANVFVDDISFVDENRVEVWTVVDNERVLLYLLKLYGNEWKISSW